MKTFEEEIYDVLSEKLLVLPRVRTGERLHGIQQQKVDEADLKQVLLTLPLSASEDVDLFQTSPYYICLGDDDGFEQVMFKMDQLSTSDMTRKTATEERLSVPVNIELKTKDGRAYRDCKYSSFIKAFARDLYAFYFEKMMAAMHVSKNSRDSVETALKIRSGFKYFVRNGFDAMMIQSSKFSDVVILGYDMKGFDPKANYELDRVRLFRFPERTKTLQRQIHAFCQEKKREKTAAGIGKK